MKNYAFVLLMFVSVLAHAQSSGDLFNQGKLLYEAKNYPEALVKFDAAEKAGSKEAELFILKGNSQVYLDDKIAAIGSYTKAIERDAKSARAYCNRGIMYKGQRQYDKAIADFTAAISADSNYKDAYEQRGGLYLNGNLLQDAISDFENYLKIDKTSASMYGFLGVAYGRLEGKANKRKGIDSFTNAIALENDNANYYYFRGYLYLDLFDNKAAMADLDKTIALDPNYGDAYFERGNLYFRYKDPKRQLENYAKAIAVDPNSGRYLYWRGMALLEQGDKNGACVDFNKAIALGYQKADTMKSLCSSKGTTITVTDWQNH